MDAVDYSRSSSQSPRGKPKSKSRSKKKRRPTKRQDFSQKRFKEGAIKAMERFFGQNSYPTVEECAVRCHFRHHTQTP